VISYAEITMSTDEEKTTEQEKKIELSPKAEAQASVLRAAWDRINNIMNPATGYQSLRDSGENIRSAEEDLRDLLSELSKTSENMQAAYRKLQRGEALPEINIEGGSMIDLVFTDYTKE
jgi:hypothetical protein